ncbi:MAG: flagellar basal body L-ring protein FlgH [Alphaproteobacteria bacterium]|nr:flagellar basal body L-ring protein FlgH [Alphaproteobacteria bacterium]
MIHSRKSITVLGLALITCTALSACSSTADRIANIGKAPEMTKIANPVAERDYQPVSLPMPVPQNVSPQKNSLWDSSRTTFFKDQRASNVGDIITVLIDIDDKAELANETERTRASNEDAGLPALLGYEQALDRVLPEAVDNTSLTGFDSNSSHVGSGTVDRDEKIEVKVAGLVTQILPNGNMVIHGRQEVLVNFEKRILQVDGVIRPEDITTTNTISYEQIAEARIVYGGEGQISDMQQPRYGQQLYDIIFPF